MDTRSFRQQRSRFFHNRDQGFFNGYRFNHGDFDDHGVFHEFDKAQGFAWDEDGRFEYDEEDYGDYDDSGNPWLKVVNRKDKYKHANPSASFPINKPKNFSKSWKDVDEWSTTVYVTNLPPLATVKGIRDQCMKAGNVVDVFVPEKTAHTGKKYAFVRFNKGSDISNIIYKIRNLWIGNFRLYADVTRFKRGSQAKNVDSKVEENKKVSVDNKIGEKQGTKVWKKVTNGVKDSGGENIESHSVNGAAGAQILKGAGHKETDPKVDVVNIKDKGTVSDVVIIKDIPFDSFVTAEDLSGSLCLRVKNIANMRQLHQFAFNEGFEDISFQYLGGFWVRVDCGSKAECVKFSKCEGLKPLFHSCIKPKADFVINERVVWVEVRGLPLCAWNNVVANHVAKKWGECLFGMEDIEESLSCGRVCILTKRMDRIQDKARVEINGILYDLDVVEFQTWSPCFERSQEEESGSEEEEDEVGSRDEDNVSVENFEVVDNVDASKDINDHDDHSQCFENDEVGNNKYDSSDPCNISEFLNKFEEGKMVSLSLSVPPGFERIEKKGEMEVNSGFLKVVTPVLEAECNTDGYGFCNKAATSVLNGGNSDTVIYEDTVSDNMGQRGVRRCDSWIGNGWY
ncbi:hypothetical protein SSX86_026447 [Deinandra increscens subsp. villosa]|uniref:RRM domain-containing protein n=1 Tax=Deinandra increscens subsp. villosa TaxID=3103831 RepID=A0AAP0GP59_9ASTR